MCLVIFVATERELFFVAMCIHPINFKLRLEFFKPDMRNKTDENRWKKQNGGM